MSQRYESRTRTSSWLTTLPLKEEGYDLTKQLFWDLDLIGHYRDYYEFVNVA